MAKRNNPMAPYFVQMREAERRLVNGALEHAAETLGPTNTFEDRAGLAASLLGVHMTYIKVRGRVLGGVLPDDPKHEPPGNATEIWHQENKASKKTRSPNPKPHKPSIKPPKPAKPKPVMHLGNTPITIDQLVNDETYETYVPTSADGGIIGEPLAHRLGDNDGGNVLAFVLKEAEPDA